MMKNQAQNLPFRNQVIVEKVVKQKHSNSNPKKPKTFERVEMR